MHDRPFGRRSGLQVGPISLGAMRFPKDPAAAVAVIRHAIERGLRYIDTSRGYGDSELLLAQALKGGWRDQVILSTKWAPWIVKYGPDDDASAGSVRRRLEESLRRLEVERLDFYQVWAVSDPEHWQQATRPGGMLDGLRQAQREGLIAHLGFTTHAPIPWLLEILPQAEWCEALLVTYNLLDRSHAEVLRLAHRLGMATIVMNPMGGGSLAEPSPVLQRLADQAGVASMPELAIRYILSNPDVDTLISGVSRLSDVDTTLAAAAAGPLPPSCLSATEAAVDALASGRAAGCTGCRYCLPCPQGIDIPAIMRAVHDKRVYGLDKRPRETYRWVTAKAGPRHCTACRSCESRCTQHLPIVEDLRWAQAHLEGTEPQP